MQGNALRPAKAADYLGVGLSTFWLKAKTDPDFPPLIKLSPRTTVVQQAALDRYLATKAAQTLASAPAAK